MDMSEPPAVSTVSAQQLKSPDSLWVVSSMASDYKVAKFVLVSCVLRKMSVTHPCQACSTFSTGTPLVSGRQMITNSVARITQPAKNRKTPYCRTAHHILTTDT